MKMNEDLRRDNELFRLVECLGLLAGPVPGLSMLEELVAKIVERFRRNFE